MYSAQSEKYISAVVSRFSYVNVGSLNPAAIQRCIQWVIEQAHSVENKQLLFLCATLGYIAHVKDFGWLQLPNDETTKHVCDKFLKNLETCFRKGFRIPDNCLHLLKRSAYTLVQGSSKPGWLTFAAYFRPFFGMKYVLDVRMKSCAYSKDEYWKLLSLLVFGVTSIKNPRTEEREFYQLFLKRILKFAPDEDVLFQMFQYKDLYRFFYSPSDREHFFTEFYKDSVNSRAENLDERIKRLNKLPAHVRAKMSGLVFGYVQQFIDNVVEPSPDETDAVFHLISENFSDDNFLYLLRHLSKSSSSATHHDLFLQLLNDQKFSRKWEKVSPREKVNICLAWVNARSSREIGARIKAIFQAVDILISCAHISSNENVIHDLCGHAFNWLLQHEDSTRIIEEFKEIENYSPGIQNCFKQLITETFRRKPHLLTKEEILANLSGNTR